MKKFDRAKQFSELMKEKKGLDKGHDEEKIELKNRKPDTVGSLKRKGSDGSSQSLLRADVLLEHERSQHDKLNVGADVTNRVTTWINNVSLPTGGRPGSPTLDNNAIYTVHEPSSATHLVDVSKSERVFEKLERVKSLLLTDDKGEEMEEIVPSTKGRYVPHLKEDTAFKPIDFTELSQVVEAGTVDQSASNTSITSTEYSSLKIADQMRRASNIARRLSERRTSSLSYRPSSIDRRLSTDTEVSSAETTTPSFGESEDILTPSIAVEGRKAEQGAASSPKTGPKIGIGTGVKLHKWKKRAENVKTTGTKTFARNESHYKLLKDTSQRIAVEVPLPLRIALYEDLFPVICQTVKSYERHLGKKHQLTKEAIDKQNSMARWGSVLTDL